MKPIISNNQAVLLNYAAGGVGDPTTEMQKWRQKRAAQALLEEVKQPSDWAKRRQFEKQKKRLNKTLRRYGAPGL